MVHWEALTVLSDLLHCKPPSPGLRLTLSRSIKITNPFVPDRHLVDAHTHAGSPLLAVTREKWLSAMGLKDWLRGSNTLTCRGATSTASPCESSSSSAWSLGSSMWIRCAGRSRVRPARSPPAGSAVRPARSSRDDHPACGGFPGRGDERRSGRQAMSRASAEPVRSGCQNEPRVGSSPGAGC